MSVLEYPLPSYVFSQQKPLFSNVRHNVHHNVRHNSQHHITIKVVHLSRINESRYDSELGDPHDDRWIDEEWLDEINLEEKQESEEELEEELKEEPEEPHHENIRKRRMLDSTKPPKKRFIVQP